jgi:hypothetical protein
MSGRYLTAIGAVMLGIVLLLGSTLVWAQPPRHHSRRAARVNTRWEHKADRNHDGYVGPHEADKAKKDFMKHNGN